MDAANNAVGIFYFVYHCFSHIQLARQFESELNRWQIKLDLIQIELDLIQIAPELIQKRPNRWSKTSNSDTSPLAVREVTSGLRIISADRERTTAEIICAIQETLYIARCEAAKIKVDLSDPKKMQPRITEFLNKRRVQTAKAVGGMKWAFYKRDQFKRCIADINALVADLQRLPGCQ